MKVLVAGWIGSTNLGDELVFAGLRTLLKEHDAEVAAISRDPAATRRVHGVGAVSDTDLHGLLRAAGAADLVVFGGGGLLQDTTSPFNLPYHLSRILAARLRGTPVVGVGLGAGALDTRLGRAEVARALPAMTGISVRDRDSQRLLAGLGGDRVQLGADLAFALADTVSEGGTGAPSSSGLSDRLAVCLRPWGGRRGRLPAQARGDTTPTEQVLALAAQLDRIAARTGLAVHFVALQHDRDDAFHRRVAAHMRAPASFATPALDELLPEVASAAAVIAMRYHGGVAALLTGRPAVLLGYAPKVHALAEEVGPEAAVLDLEADHLHHLDAAVAGVLAAAPAFDAARDRLVARQEVNRQVLRQGLEHGGGR